MVMSAFLLPNSSDMIIKNIHGGVLVFGGSLLEKAFSEEKMRRRKTKEVKIKMCGGTCKTMGFSSLYGVTL